jgi:Domain of unknown function (DUF4926)
MDEIKSLDVVALLVDLPEHRLRRGAVGTVVEVFTANEHHPGGYMIEFVDESGHTYAIADITDAAQLIPLRFRQEAA